jgi:hypothetical protein
MGSKHSFAGLSALELKCVELRCKGLTYREIGKLVGKPDNHVWTELSRVCRKARIENNLPTIREWAEKWGFDEPLPPETPEERARPGKPVPRYQKILLGRIRRAAAKMIHPVKVVKYERRVGGSDPNARQNICGL